MRLTLRNLLRFLDRSDLDPTERAQLEGLVNKSDRATAWIHRIKSLRSDPRKSAPALKDHSSIAEVTRYIDGSMTEQEAIEFEKTMLASDPILAEVASVHHLVHQKRSARSDPVSLVLRQTLYDIDRVYAASAEKVAAGGGDTNGTFAPTSMTDLPFEDSLEFEDEPAFKSGATTTGSNGEPQSIQPPVSLEQMKRQSKGRSWMAVAIVIGTLIGTTSLSFWLGQKTASRRPVAVYDEPETADNKTANGAETVADKPDSDPDKSTSDNPETDTSDPDVAESLPEVDRPPAVFADYPRRPEPKAESDESGAEPGDRLPRRPDIIWSLYTPIPPEEFIGPILPPRVVARSGLRQPTVLFKSGDSEWGVVDAQAQLLEGSEVLVLSGSEATFELDSSLTLIATGPASFTFGKFDRASGADLIELNFGRIRITSELSDVDWLLGVDSDVYRITMIAAQSTVEADAGRYFLPGADPRMEQPVRMRAIRSVAGRSLVQWGESTRDLTAGSALIQSQSDWPEWAIPVQQGVYEPVKSKLRYVERVGGVVDSDSRKWTESETDIPSELLNLKNDSRQEVRLAAMTWLAELGQFEFIVDYFENEDNKSNWRTFLEGIRSTIQSRPEYAEPLFAALALAGNVDQPRWYKLILGYSPNELETGADSQLVELLSDNSLGIRALAIENLREITGGITYGYLPTRNTSERNRTINRQWKPMLEKNEIRYATPPAPPLPHVTIAPLMPDQAEGGSDDSSSEGK